MPEARENPATARQRYRNIPGGLDNAVMQAEARGLRELFIVDTDCHISEPYDLFVRTLPQEYQKMLRWEDSEVDPLLAKQAGIFGKHAVYGVRVKRPEVSFPKQQSPDDIIDEFARRMVDLGIKRSIIIPNMIVRLPLDPRPARFEAEVARAYIDFMIESFLDKYPEIRATVYVPVKDPRMGAELIDDVGAEKGIVGALLSVLTKTRAGSDDWNPIYEAAQQKDLPICIHGDAIHAEERGWLFGDFDTLLPVHVLSFPLLLSRSIMSIVLDGVPVRFPRLKFVFMEGGLTYVPALMQRLDDDYVKRRHEAPLLTKLPSEYMNEFYYTTQPLESAHKEALEPFFRMFDSENKLMYASDYPHWDFDAPSVIWDLPYLSTDAKKKILGGNAAKVFKVR
ncbi:MAG: amidohydrolase [Thaumarchaeota archaeon]|nr:amidohydrolase [Nitrososphaerota archaeon]